ncbi:hypothetical protein LJC27_05095 [Christensenellaceae bacterium OttesenSCG-928-M15]|nr:hypothetical protein [Christensenellaceae bacterium OttesenSCG-928-M15]
MSRERFTIRMQTDDPRHLRVWNEINAIPAGKRSEYLVQLILQALDQEELVYRAVKRALQEYQPQFIPPQPNTAKSEADIPDEMLGFIFSLQEEKN